MSDARTRRFVIAPIGEQGAAVLAPLLSPPVRPNDKDILIIIYSDNPGMSKLAERIQNSLKATTGVTTREPVMWSRRLSSPDHSEATETERAIHQIEQQMTDRDVNTAFVLANGGPTEWLFYLLRALRHREPAFSTIAIAQSRDHSGEVLTIRQEGTDLYPPDVSPFAVQDTGRKTLLEFLSVERTRTGRKLYKRHEEPGRAESSLEGVVSAFPRERSGFLYAAVDLDLDRWTEDKRKKKVAARLRWYRRELLDHGNLRELGLERRRVFLSSSNHQADEALLDRAIDDGFPVTTVSSLAKSWTRPVSDLGSWRECIEKGYAMDLAEEQYVDARQSLVLEHLERSRATLSSYTFRDAQWQDDAGSILVTTLGPQPGSTLQTIWNHKPACLVLIVDLEHPVVDCLQHRFLTRPVHRSRNLHLVEWCSLWTTLDEVAKQRSSLAIDLKPGEKRISTRLMIWALHHGLDANCWSLARSPSRSLCLCGGSKEIPSVPLPVVTWIDAHSILKTLVQPFEPPPELTGIWQDFLTWLGDRTSNHKDIGMLWQRTAPPSVISCRGKTSLAVPGKRGKKPHQVHVGTERLAAALRPLEEGGPNGTWFEWLTGQALYSAHLDEVCLDVRVFRHGETVDRHSRFRDQVDLITRQGTEYALWSCKLETANRSIEYNLREARGNADRLLGRQQSAVLVVPRLPQSLKVGFERNPAFPCHWVRIGSTKDHVVDSSFLLDASWIKRIAAGRASPPPRRVA